MAQKIGPSAKHQGTVYYLVESVIIYRVFLGLLITFYPCPDLTVKQQFSKEAFFPGEGKYLRYTREQASWPIFAHGLLPHLFFVWSKLQRVDIFRMGLEIS